ncbi:hypothetical protein FACS18948_5210 [Clostridia bacterium]|nr:hypothetical protein FACS18948_5210 [Clostridia bacterium]
MSVTAGYLNRVRRSVRVGGNADIDEEITEMIEECRADLQSVGVSRDKTRDETDSLILGAVRCFVRWKFGVNNDEAERNRDDYQILKEDLRKKRGYQCISVTE